MIPREFLGAFKAGHRASARPFIDEELSRKLLSRVLRQGCEESRRHLEYITKFNNEYYKAVVKKDDPKALHSTVELRQDCFSRNNSINRDVYSSQGTVVFLEDLKKSG